MKKISPSTRLKDIITDYQLDQIFPGDCLSQLDLVLYQAGDYICRQGSEQDVIPYFLKGRLKIVHSLENGIDTIIGERGVRLSGGQLQRVSIARALYNHPQVIIFDEATSALDTATEQAIQQTIESLRSHMTVIIIAHRLTTVEKCDWLYWIDKGRIKTEGNSLDIIFKYQNS